ncbi:MAG: VOC family protein, partial [Halieaceae bacterium]|nr:VOC family protein [Halieaceae bacterium]
MRNRHGDFIWYELMTSDADAAQTFYGGLVGWKFESAGQPGMDYRLFSADGPPVGGVMALTKEMQAGGARPLWAGYVGVDDVDASAKAISEAGGQILMGPFEIPGVGPIAFATDPQGAPFY